MTASIAQRAQHERSYKRARRIRPPGVGAGVGVGLVLLLLFNTTRTRSGPPSTRATGLVWARPVGRAFSKGFSFVNATLRASGDTQCLPN